MNKEIRGCLRTKNTANFLNRVEKGLQGGGCLKPRNTLLLALSGGQDSACLLLILLQLETKWGWGLRVAHCNHLWQPDSPYLFKQALHLCFLLNTSSCLSIAPQVVASEQKARDWRYQWLQRVSQVCQADVLLTGHTATDRTETVFLHLTRGSGSRGALPIKWKRSFLSPYRKDWNCLLPRWCFCQQPASQPPSTGSRRFCPSEQAPPFTQIGCIPVAETSSFHGGRRWAVVVCKHAGLITVQLTNQPQLAGLSSDCLGRRDGCRRGSSLLAGGTTGSFLLEGNSWCSLYRETWLRQVVNYTRARAAARYTTGVLSVHTSSYIPIKQKANICCHLASEGCSNQSRLFERKPAIDQWHHFLFNRFRPLNVYLLLGMTAQTNTWMHGGGSVNQQPLSSSAHLSSLWIGGEPFKSVLSQSACPFRLQLFWFDIFSTWLQLFAIDIGCSFKQQLSLYRPLLKASRFDLQTLGFFWKVPVFQDKTNSSLSFCRNRTRTQLMPILRSFYNRQVDKVVFHYGEISHSEEAFLESVANRVGHNQTSRRSVKLITLSLRSLPVSMQRRVVKKVLQAYTSSNPSFAAVEAVASLAGSLAKHQDEGLTKPFLCANNSFLVWPQNVALSVCSDAIHLFCNL